MDRRDLSPIQIQCLHKVLYADIFRYFLLRYYEAD